MSYKRRYYKRKRGYKQRRYGRSLAKRAYYLAKKVQRECKPEYKFIDSSADNTDFWTTPIVSSIVTIGQGDGEEERTGERVILKSVQCRWEMKIDVDASGSDIGRFVIVTEKNPMGVAPVWTDVFKSANVNALRAMTNATNWKVLYDKRVVFNNTNDVAGATIRKYGEVYRKINLPCEFNNTATAPLKNGLYIMYMSTATQAKGDLTFRIRVRFTNS